MSEPEIFDKKPVRVTLEPGTYFWCACGLSTNPFATVRTKERELPR